MTTTYLTESKFRAAAKKALGLKVNSKSDTERGTPFGINIVNAIGHWEKDATIFRVTSAWAEDMEQIEVERTLVLCGFEMVETDGDKSVNIAWRKAA